jgi:hypothetical protein
VWRDGVVTLTRRTRLAIATPGGLIFSKMSFTERLFTLLLLLQ